MTLTPTSIALLSLLRRLLSGTIRSRLFKYLAPLTPVSVGSVQVTEVADGDLRRIPSRGWTTTHPSHVW